jgi:hypothetical protein
MLFISTPLARVRATLFVVAGALMLVSVLLLATARFSLADIPQTTIALPAMGAQIACILGLVGLYPALAGAGFFARAGFIAALAAGFILFGGIAIVASSGTSAPTLLNTLAYAFTIAIALAFALNGGAAFLTYGFRAALGHLLLAPALIWLVIIIVGASVGLSAALSLDVYTNAIVSLLLLTLGNVLRRRTPSPTGPGR